MGSLEIFCAGASFEVLPAKKVRNILVNVLDHGINERAIKYTKNMFKYAETEKRFLDSGGYQIYKAEEQRKTMTFEPTLPIMRSEHAINVSPAHVVETACRLQPDMMTSLDYPIRKISDRGAQEHEFLRKLGFNMRWAIETAYLRKRYCPNIQLLIPVQCYHLDQFHLFHNSIQPLSIDGLSMPLRNLELKEIALFLLRFHQLGVKKVHLLGSTSFFVMALAAYFARHFFEWVSLDATSWRLTAEYKGYLNPNDLSWEYIGDEVLIDENIPMMCQCPFCQNSTFTFIKNLPYTDKVAFLRSHNFYVTEKAGQDLYENASNLLSFEKFLMRSSRKPKDIEDLIRCLSIMDIYKREDVNVLKQLLRIDT